MTSPLTPLSREFYKRETRLVAQELLNCLLVKCESEDEFLVGRITETEAYLHDDPACHAFRGKTPRNAPMFGEPGTAYVYFTYGMHYCFNVVTEPEGIAGAVLIRALEPLVGWERMAQNRRLIEEISVSVIETEPINEIKEEKERLRLGKFLLGGPAKLCQAFGIERDTNGTDLTQSEPLFIARDLERFPCSLREDILATPRIGISKAQDRPWRYTLRGEKYASR